MNLKDANIIYALAYIINRTIWRIHQKIQICILLFVPSLVCCTYVFVALIWSTEYQRCNNGDTTVIELT